jgi:GNAT superfamily N-acetyltransferase
MPGIDIVEIKDRQGLKKFIDFAWDIYKGDSCWVPPLKSDMMDTLTGKNNPLFKNGPHTFFMVYRYGKPAGRICTGINENLNKKKNRNEGYISLFECVDDEEISCALFDAALSWLKAWGVTCVKGPVSPTNGDDYRGLLVEGFDGPPVLMNSYNPPYYVSLFEKSGFKKYLDLYAYYYDLSIIDLNRYTRPVEYAMKRYDFRVEPIKLKYIEREMLDIKQVLDVAMPEEWEDLTPPSIEEIKAEARKLRHLAVPNLIYIARNGCRPIGFSVALPDYNQVLRHLNGRIFPWGFLKFLWLKRKISGGRLFVLFVIPEYRKKAVSSAILFKTLKAAKARGYIYGEGSTIGETNSSMKRDAEGMGGKHYRTYRIFYKDLT